MDLFSSALTVLTFLCEPRHITRACFMMVMTSRMVFGDDRLVRLMERDLFAEID